MSGPERGLPGSWEYLVFWRDDAIDPEPTSRALPDNDRDAARTITAEFPGWLHHATLTSTWYIWDGRCHRPDDHDRISRMIMEWGERLERAAGAIKTQIRNAVTAMMPDAPDTEIAREIARLEEPFTPAAKYAASIRRSAGLAALRTVLASVCGTSEDELADRNPELLNFANGTLDLRTGWLRQHDPADMITYCLDSGYRPHPAPWELCPQFVRLASRAVGDNKDVLGFLMQVLGYAVLGDNREQKIIYLSGPTGSGKSKLLWLVSEVLGALGTESQADLITIVRHGRNARTENSIRGARFISITETSSFMLTDEAQVKRLTGEPVISVDQHYAKRTIKTPVTWLIFVATNQMPTLTNFDDAMKRRIVVVPCGASLPGHEMDPTIAPRILAQERDGIAALLAWCARQYLARGSLMVPHVVAMKTDEYAREQNTVANFISERCVMAPGAGPDGQPFSESQSVLWSAYLDWARGSSRLGRNEFYTHLARQPGVVRNETMTRFEGIRLLDITATMAGWR